MNRGVDRQDIFATDADRRLFLAFMAHAADEGGVEIHAYCLMTTHFHLIVHCPNGGLSDFMQAFCRRYAQAFNQRVEREGPVFTGRFLSVPIGADDDGDADAAFLMSVRYVHRNPLDLLPISALSAYAYSSYPAYLAEAPVPNWLTATTVSRLHDGADAVRRFTEVAHPSDSTPAKGRVAVSPATVDVFQAVASAAGLSIDDVLHKRPGVRNDARLVAAHLCTKFRTAPVAELAEAFGIRSNQGLRQIAARGKNLVTLDSQAARLHERSLAVLWTEARAA